MKVLVTGGAGFIGSHIVDLLVELGYEVIVVDNLSSGNSTFLPPNITFYKADIQSSILNEIFMKEKPAYVIHQAAQVDVSRSILDPSEDAENNVLGTVRLLSCCIKHNVQKIIYASSCAVYGETDDCSITESFPIKPLSFYGLSKYTPEVYIKLFHDLYGLPYTILRYANIYGPRQSPKGEGGVVSIFLKKLISKEAPAIFGNGEQTRDFVYVKDVAMANMLSLHKGENEILNISRNEKTSINQLYHMITSIVVSNPPSPFYQAPRKGDILYSKLDNAKAKRILGWEPKYNLMKGLQESYEYYLHEYTKES
ncbi:NAD-dependent epimerase/dehydratase family protein [Bacillus sp. JJ1521]|uniref:NAD-dependent epimerase/dehydratase family protein n=1 Tax=Bacillus sp. JJ1521 TaxID=3122957 RepID=UPI002FFDE741